MADDSPDPDRIATQQDFGRELTAIRTRAGLTVRQVARAAELPVSTAGDYFSGRHLPSDGRPEQLLGILRACGETDPALLARWMGALQRARRPPGRRPGGADAPYRGLARFEREDARWFFGREDVTDLLAALADEEKQLPLVLVGPSGAGKSSLLRAGLIPRLTGPLGLVEPADAPLAALHAQLAELHASGDTARPTIIVDQFEAIFTQCQDETERREFVTEVCELAKTALVILTLRADFYTHALRHPGLAAALQARQVVLGPMAAEQVRRAITEPARLARLDVEEGLVGLLLRDLAPPRPASEQAAYEPGALPLLSHALLATWEHSRGGMLTVADYLASGGIRDALTRTAEAAYGSLSPEEQRLARRLFLRLVHVADDAPPTRATVRLSELEAWDGETGHVLGRFVDERLITVDADVAQITHDALLVAWPRLRSWIEVGLENLLTRRRVAEGARGWQDAGRESAALWRGSQLATARDWAADEDNHASLGTLAGEFIAASIAAEQAHERAERRRTRRLQRLVAALAVLVVAVGVLAGYSFQQRHAATVARDDANSREIALEAGQVRGQDAPLAADLSVAAYDTARTPQATASLLESTGAPSAARLLDSAGVVQSVSLSPDHALLAVAAADGTLRLWDVAAPGHPVPVGAPLVRADDSPLYATAFSPDGKILAAAGAGRTVQLWDVSLRPSGPARPPDRPGQHGVLGDVQPGRKDAGRGQRRRDSAAVGCERPGAPRTARQAADRGSRIRAVCRVRSRRDDPGGRQRGPYGAAVGRRRSGLAEAAGRTADRPGKPGDGGGVQPGGQPARRGQPGPQTLAVAGQRSGGYPGRHAHRGRELAERGRVQPRRDGRRGGDRRRQRAGVEPGHPLADCDAAASAAGHLAGLGRCRAAGRG